MKCKCLNMLLLIAAALAPLAASTESPAADLSLEGPALVKATLLADADAAVPGRELMLGVHLKMKPHWHTYWVNPGESGEATKIKLSGPEGFTFGKVQWPLPHAIESFGAITYGYEDEVLLLVPVSVAKDVKIDGKAKIDAHIVWLACNDTCIEGEAKLSISLPISGESNGANQKQFDSWRGQIPAASASAIKLIEQSKDAKGAPQAALTVDWNEEPHKVEWFPIGTPAVAIENVVVKHEGKQTAISYKATVYKADQVPGGIVEGVIVYEDAKGRRQGVAMSFKVATGE